MRTLATTLIFISSGLCQANIGGKISKWFKDHNNANLTPAGIYEGQTARYLTMGGVSQSAPVVYPFRFVQVQTPKFSAGCGGIDFYSGGFSAINADEFIKNLSVIAQNAQGLAYMLALQIVSPQISGVLEDMQTFAQKYLTFDMNSCEAATKIVGGTMDYFGAKEANCTLKRLQENTGEDWTQANYACTTGGKIKSSEGSEPNKLDFVKGNLAWFVLMHDEIFRNDTAFAEIVMNITGTIVISDAGGSDDDPSVIRVISPAISDLTKKKRFENIYNSLLLGKKHKSKLALYQCSSRTSSKEGCIRIKDTIQKQSISWEGLYSKVDMVVQEILEAIYDDKTVSVEGRNLISSSSVPIYRYLTTIAAYYPRSVSKVGLTGEYTKLIAEDILLNALSSIIERVEQQASDLKNGMSNTKRVKAFRADLGKVLSGLAIMKNSNKTNARKYYEMHQRIQAYEKALMSRLASGFVANATWGG